MIFQNKGIRFICILLLVCLCSFSTYAQEKPEKASKVLIENADRSINQIIKKTNTQYLKGNVRVIHDSIFMFCDSAVLQKNQLNAIGDVIIIQEDTIRIFADSLYYNGDTKKAELYFGVVLENREKQMFTETLFYDLETKQATFNDTCLLVNGDLKLSSLRANYNVKSNMAYFYEEVTAIDGDTRFKADSLLYDTDIDRAYFITSTYIQQGEKKIYCEDGFYDLVDKRAYFAGNPIYFDRDQYAKAEYMFYTAADSLTVLNGNAYVRDSLSEARADKISLDEKTDDIILEGNAEYKEEDKLIKGHLIIYNQTTEDVRIDGTCEVQLKEGTMSGDSLSYIKATDRGLVSGNAVWLDTVENRRIDSDIFHYREKNEYFKAFVKDRRPIVRQLVDGDTLYFSADTLTSARGELDSMKFLEAVRYVRIFKSDLQAVCDSMYFSEKDSIIHLHGKPIVWSDTTQFTADTIQLVLKKDEVKEIIARSRAFIISNDTADYYNQIKGKYIHAYLDSNHLRKMIVRSNAQSLYFVKDEDEAFIGPTKTLCSHMSFYFDRNELLTIRYYTDPDSELIPLKKAGPDELRLKDFKWHISEKPKTWEDVLRVKRTKKAASADGESQDVFQRDVESVINKKNIPPSKKGKR